ncbi:hypothetical protein EZS27_012508 [termite gut metagenome]|uniref:Transmembrane protein n=1 Tax=termite gut metagenome TaxID=433724 RepID=A0A5J4S081_9ZZZZ
MASSTKRTSIPSVLSKGNYFYYKIVCILIFLLSVIYFTVYQNSLLLIKMEDLSLFVFDKPYFNDCMQVAGGLLTYCGSFLTQLFYYPRLGSLIYVCVLLLLSFLFYKTYRVPDEYFPLVLIPAVMFVLSLTELGYLIYNFKSPGYAYSNLLGVILSLSAFWGYRNIKLRIIRLVIIPVFMLSCYPLLGFYALSASLLCIVYETVSYIGCKDRNPLCGIAVVMISMGIIPCLYYVTIYSQMNFKYIYVYGLPDFHFNAQELVLWVPFAVIFLCVFLYLIFLFKRPRNAGFMRSSLYALFLFVFSLFAVQRYSFKDENFRTEIAMDLAIQANDWNKVIDYAEQIKHLPTRLVILNRNLALYKLGLAGDKMFTYENSSVLYNLRRNTVMLGAKPLYFHYGKINFCYRWCMEDHVEYGMKVDYLKYMIKCSLIHEDLRLAQKYINVLKKTLFHKEWAENYQQYIDNPLLIREDPEFASVFPLMAYDNILDGDGNLIEVYLLNNLAHTQGGPPPLVELSLQCNLILKDIKGFLPRFFLYAKTHENIPVHYQEAALLYSHLENNVDISYLSIGGEVINRFNEFIRLSEQNVNAQEEYLKKIFRLHFGDTFWYYYFFVKDMKTS